MPPANLAFAAQLKQRLHHALQAIAPLDECALLDFPAGENIGSYLLWLATVSYCAESYSSVVEDSILTMLSVVTPTGLPAPATRPCQ